MEKPNKYDLYEEVKRRQSSSLIITVTLNPMVDTLVIVNTTDPCYWVELSIDVQNTYLMPVIYARDNRCRRSFKYEDYVHLSDLTDDLIKYIERIACDYRTKKDYIGAGWTSGRAST